MGFYWLWNSFLGRDIAYISSCSRAGGSLWGYMGSSSFSGSRRWLSEPHVLSERLSSLWSEWSYMRGRFRFGLKWGHMRGWVILEWGCR